jgi:hypothetical protein
MLALAAEDAKNGMRTAIAIVRLLLSMGAFPSRRFAGEDFVTLNLSRQILREVIRKG